MISVVGIDGSGKTTLIDKMGWKAKHAIPLTKPFISSEHALTREVFFGFEKILQRLLNPFPKYTDRCFICGEVYAKFFTIKHNNRLIYIISNLFNRVMSKPDIIVFIDTPIEICAERKKDRFTVRDLHLLRRLYYVFLSQYNYKEICTTTLPDSTIRLYWRE